MTIFNPHYQQTKAYSARLDRQLIQDIFRNEGILYDADFVVSPSSGTTVTISSGRCLVQGDTNAGQGLYRFFMDAAEQVTHTPDATNPRIDLVVARVQDATEVGSGPTSSTIEIVQGNANASATAANLIGGPGQTSGPAIPDTAMPLAYVRVPTSGAIVAGDIVDARPRTGGVPGTLVPTMRSTADDGHVMCDGSLKRRVTYARLAAIMILIPGHDGDGSTTFKLPFVNNGRVLVGFDAGQAEFDALGETGGAKTHVLASSEMPAHNHPITVNANNFNTGGISANHTHSFTAYGFTYANGGVSGVALHATAFPTSIGTGTVSSDHVHNANHGHSASSSNSGGGGAHNNLQPYQVCNFQIRA